MPKGIKTRVMKDIIKEEKVGYLQSKINMMQGKLYLTPNKLVLEAHKTGVSGLGVLGALLKRKVESKTYGFDLNLDQIKGVAQGKHGVQKNVLEITSNRDETFRIVVKNYAEWESELKKK